MAGEPRPSRPKGLKRSSAALYKYVLSLTEFYFRSRVSPIPRVVPVKRPRVAVPLVRRVKSLPVKVLACSASVLPTNGNKKRRTELQAIKSELTQIKSNIEALLGRLEQITEEGQNSTTDRLILVNHALMKLLEAVDCIKIQTGKISG
uniref:RALY heteroous nuclear ribonucleoprotein n=1 Tax=Cyprinodon variegatus TaxID=28743 RepID=A0A3Q2DP09_CYPVA